MYGKFSHCADSVVSVEWIMDNWAVNDLNMNASGAATEQMNNKYIQLCCVLNYRQGSLSLFFLSPFHAL